jgi:SAM-dependent methyltransferase
MLSRAESSRTTGVASGPIVDGLQTGLDRVLSVAYGAVYDSIVERFVPYQELQRAVVALVETALAAAASRRDVRVLDVGCGPGTLAFTLAQRGFTVVGVEPYGALVDLAREKRRARKLQNLSFRQGDLARGDLFAEATFEQVVNVHSLYAHPAPHRVLREACRVLKPRGHAVFVNPARRLGVGATVRQAHAQGGLRRVAGSLLWALPNGIFESTRRRVGPHYWDEREFTLALEDAGFTVLETRRAFVDDTSVLAWARKDGTR